MQEITRENLLELQGGDRAAAGGDCRMFLAGLTYIMIGGLMLGGVGIAFGVGFVAGALASESNPC